MARACDWRDLAAGCCLVLVAGVLVTVAGSVQGCAGPPELPPGVNERDLPDDPPRIRRLLEREPGNMGAWRRLWWLAEEEDERLEVARACVSANPRSDVAHGIMGAHFWNYGHDVDAEVSFRRALEQNPGSECAISLASIYGNYGRTEDAAALLEQALSRCVGDPEFPEHVKLEKALRLNHLGRHDAAGEWAKRIGGDWIHVWALQAYAAAGRDFGKIPEPPAWTWKPGRGSVSENYGSWGTVHAHSPLVHAMRLMAMAETPADITRIEAWYRKGLAEIDTQQGRQTCLAGLLIAAWLREGLKREPGVPAEHAGLMERVHGIGGMPGCFYDAMQGVPGAGPMLDIPQYFPVRSPTTAIRLLRLALIQHGTGDFQYESTRFTLPADRTGKWMLDWAQAEPNQPEFVLAAAGVEYGKRRYLECIALARRVIALLDAEKDKPTSWTSGDHWQSGLILSLAPPPPEEMMRYEAEGLIELARYYGGERDVIVREIEDREAKHNPRRPGQHWILRLDEYWREVEKRGLAKFPGA